MATNTASSNQEPSSLSRSVEKRLKAQKQTISEARTAAVLSRWDSVREEQQKWLDPFTKLPLERALQYLEDLRKVTERAGFIINERINSPGKPIRCAGTRCGKDVSGTNPSGTPRYIAVVYQKDPRHPEIGQNLYFCSELCKNQWVRDGQGARGTDGK